MQVFEDVYAVGCPLGNDPIPTHGKLSDTSHMVDGTKHWMVSAPTYIGNSGGGIFHAESEELVGIFSKLYTHGSLHQGWERGGAYRLLNIVSDFEGT